MTGTNTNGNAVRVRFDSELSDLTASMPAGGSVPSPPKGTPPGDPDANFKKMLGSPPPPTQATPPTKHRASNLRGNLMRELVDRDPLFNYEVISVLGVGSMGSVAKVKKRGAAIGGSARRELQRHFSREKRLRECGSIPVFGSIFQHCIGWFMKKDEFSNSNGVDNSRHNSTNSTGSSILVPRGDTLEEDEECKYQLVYGMKSIHLSRVTDPAFVEELRNEVRILKTLDHPHIVRPVRFPLLCLRVDSVDHLCCGLLYFENTRRRLTLTLFT